jgi:hypothetical protein
MPLNNLIYIIEYELITAKSANQSQYGHYLS